MKEIRETVYEVYDRRKSEGKQWGTFGYVVGGHWKRVMKFNQKSYVNEGQSGLV